MSIQFDWKTDGEGEENAPQPPELKPVSRRIKLISLGFGAVLLLAAVIFWLWLNREAGSRTAVISQQVQASQQLVYEAAAAQDGDLFAALLSPFYGRWPETGRELLAKNLFLGRGSFSLWAKEVRPGTEPAIEFAPDMQTAVLTTDITYFAEKQGGITETVTLQQTAVYERDGSQWWLAPLPPDDDPFWGNRRTIKGDILSIVYREREAEIVRDLIFDLDDLVIEFCQIPEANCPPVFSLELRLRPEAEQLLRTAVDYRNMTMSRSGANEYRLILPSPTLIGLPVDEAGYEALYRGYGSWLTAVLLVEFNRVQTPSRQLVTDVLAQLDLPTPDRRTIRPWQLVDNPPPIPFPDQDLLMVCKRTDAYMEFWRYQLAAGKWVNEDRLFKEWFETIFNPSRQTALAPLPDDSSTLVISTMFTDQTTEIFQWGDGEAAFLTRAENVFGVLPPYFVMPPMWQDGRLLLLNQSSENFSETGWLNLSQCPGDNCALEAGEWSPRWSPDGQRTLLIDFEGEIPILWLGDGDAQAEQELGPGLSPFWLDEKTFVFLRMVATETEGEFETEVVMVAFMENGLGKPETLISSQNVNDEFDFSDKLALLSILPLPDDQATWILIAVEQPISDPGHSVYVFTYERPSAELSFAGALDFEFMGISMKIEGNGRYLTTIAPQPTISSQALNPPPMLNFSYLLFDLVNLDKTQAYNFLENDLIFSPIDWSADGNWFVLPDDEGWLWLTAPEYDYQWPLFHSLEGCGAPVWVNR